MNEHEPKMLSAPPEGDEEKPKEREASGEVLSEEGETEESPVVRAEAEATRLARENKDQHERAVGEVLARLSLDGFFREGENHTVRVMKPGEWKDWEVCVSTTTLSAEQTDPEWRKKFRENPEWEKPFRPEDKPQTKGIRLDPVEVRLQAAGYEVMACPGDPLEDMDTMDYYLKRKKATE